MRVGIVLAVPFLFVGCKNSLRYAPPGGELDCGDPGAICSVGYDDVGDGGPPLSASFVYPSSAAFHTDGSLYIADRLQNRIRRIAPDGSTIETVAGTGRESYAFVEGLPATETLAASPVGVAVTSDGTVFWSDERSCAIYAVSPTSGTVSLAAGSRCSYGGGTTPDTVLFDFSDCSKIRANGNDLVIASSERNEVRYWNRGTTPVSVAGATVQPGQVPVIASLYTPCDAVVASDGTLYVVESDYFDCRVRSISPSGVLSTVVGAVTADCNVGGDNVTATAGQVNYPTGIALDETAGLLYVTDNTRVRAVNLTGGLQQVGTVTLGTNAIATIAGDNSVDWLVSDGGSALSQAFLGAPAQPVLEPDGNLLVLDAGNGVIRRFDKSDGTLSVVAGFAEQGTLEGFMNGVGSIAFLDGDLLIAARTARVWRQSGSAREVFAGNGDREWAGDGGQATAAGVWATGIAIAGDGRVFIADAYNHRVRQIDPSGAISTVAGNGAGYSAGDGDLAVNASFEGPHAVLASAGNLYISDYDRVRYVNLGTTTVSIAGVSIGPGNIATIAGGNGNGFAGDGGPATDAQVNLNTYYTEIANGLALDSDYLYFADTYNNRIRRVHLGSGIIETVVGSGATGPDAVGRPVGLALHDGWLYWTQLDGNYVRRMRLPGGAVETLAGDGNTGYYGEGLAAIQAQLIAPQGLLVDDEGTVYVTDASHRVRRFRP